MWRVVNVYAKDLYVKIANLFRDKFRLVYSLLLFILRIKFCVALPLVKKVCVESVSG